jgi:hypothetical protein
MLVGFILNVFMPFVSKKPPRNPLTMIKTKKTKIRKVRIFEEIYGEIF